MAYALAVSLFFNVVLLCAVWWQYDRRWGKRVPWRRPDFATVERVLREELADPEVACVVALEGFEKRNSHAHLPTSFYRSNLGV